ncbi:2-octaprenyl-3-methyl-6-methoxy-1,4-benzoquinol hydroxylase [mine drainage metagenome]|uniref:2-octaprenyl-3-methyl-6-methoxy-1,4-benzoquinol hydroxylase n=1 Tax=mine drainage metagenome TaxID=410659 RepID=A0A1J5SVL5_9ZZZZ
MAMMDTDLQCDVLIVGGGLVGGPLAAALAAHGVSVVVVDREAPETALAPAFDGRASAVALGPQRVLAGCGLWPAIAPMAAPIKQIRVSDGASPLFLHYDHRVLGSDPFGWIVENRAIRQALRQRLPALPLARVLAPASISALRREAGGVSATLTDGRSIAAALVVAADGRGSPVRAGAGIGLTKWDYGQTAIVCTVAHEKPHGEVAQEHFLPSGPFAILPLPGNRSSVVWTEKSALVPGIMAQDEAAFLAEMHERFGDFLGRLCLEGPRFAYPLSLQFANAYTAQRLVLVGDAAHGMHPVAGQGMNMGLRDVAALAEVLVEAKRLGLDLGNGAVLERYARWRRFDNLLMLGLTDVMVRLFSNDIAPVRLARDLGLAAVNRLPGLKKVFMRHAMGLVGELPRLMRGEAL